MTLTIEPTVDLWPLYERDGNHAIGYIASTYDIAGLPYPRIGEVYRTPHGWAAWAMGTIFGDEDGPRSVLGFRTRRDAIHHLVTVAQTRRSDHKSPWLAA